MLPALTNTDQPPPNGAKKPAAWTWRLTGRVVHVNLEPERNKLSDERGDTSRYCESFWARGRQSKRMNSSGHDLGFLQIGLFVILICAPAFAIQAIEQLRSWHTRVGQLRRMLQTRFTRLRRRPMAICGWVDRLVFIVLTEFASIGVRLRRRLCESAKLNVVQNGTWVLRLRFCFTSAQCSVMSLRASSRCYVCFSAATICPGCVQPMLIGSRHGKRESVANSA